MSKSGFLVRIIVRIIGSAVALAGICILTLSPLHADEPIAFPDGFRSWVHVKSALITSAHPAFKSEGGIHHIYANPKAAEAYASGQFPDGSVIVYELLETVEKDGLITEGVRRRIDMMVKDGDRYKATGGWGYERYMGTASKVGVLDNAGQTGCSACHARAQDHGSVFSRMR
jgi:hypothetical protein